MSGDTFLKEYLQSLVGDVKYLRETQDEMKTSVSNLQTKVELLSEALQGGDEKKKRGALLSIYMQCSQAQPSAGAH